MALLITLTPIVHQQRNTRFFLFFSAAALFTSLALNAAKSLIPYGRIKRQHQVWWFAKVEKLVSKRREVFAAAHRSKEDRQACISASRHASSVIATAMPEAWQETCSSLSFLNLSLDLPLLCG